MADGQYGLIFINTEITLQFHDEYAIIQVVPEYAFLKELFVVEILLKFTTGIKL